MRALNLSCNMPPLMQHAAGLLAMAAAGRSAPTRLSHGGHGRRTMLSLQPKPGGRREEKAANDHGPLIRLIQPFTAHDGAVGVAAASAPPRMTPSAIIDLWVSFPTTNHQGRKNVFERIEEEGVILSWTFCTLDLWREIRPTG